MTETRFESKLSNLVDGSDSGLDGFGLCLLPEDKYMNKRNIILLGIIAAVIAIGFGAMAYIHYNSKPKYEVVVQYVDREIFRAPLNKDALYMIKDGEVSEVSADTTLASMGDEGLETKHYINMMQVKDDSVQVIESNCENQVCIAIGTLTSDTYDFPITCLPHGLIITIQ